VNLRRPLGFSHKSGVPLVVFLALMVWASFLTGAATQADLPTKSQIENFVHYFPSMTMKDALTKPSSDSVLPGNALDIIGGTSSGLMGISIFPVGTFPWDGRSVAYVYVPVRNERSPDDVNDRCALLFEKSTFRLVANPCVGPDEECDEGQCGGSDSKWIDLDGDGTLDMISLSHVNGKPRYSAKVWRGNKFVPYDRIPENRLAELYNTALSPNVRGQ
jgi:hypothetical protein